MVCLGSSLEMRCGFYLILNIIHTDNCTLNYVTLVQIIYSLPSAPLSNLKYIPINLK